MISPSKRGVLVEREAESLFLKAGFEVFSNVSPDGPADFVVWDGEVFYPIDTKKVSIYTRTDGTLWYNVNRKTFKSDVHYLGHAGDHWIWLTEPPKVIKDVPFI